MQEVAAMPISAAIQHPAPLMTPEQVSAVLGVPVTTLAIWRSTGRYKLDYIKVGKHVRYHAHEVMRFIEASERRRGGGVQ